VIDEETILIPIYKTSEDINCIYTLNKSAATVWGLINGRRSIGAIKKEVLKKFETSPDTLEKEMDELLKDLSEIKALRYEKKN
jgi:hypothetical protein